MFSTDQVCALASVTYRKMDYWTRMGLVVPAVEAAGSGTCRRFDIDELFIICVIAELMDLKAGTTCASRVATQLRMVAAEPRGTVEPLDGRIFIDVDGFIRSGTMAAGYVIDLAAIRSKLDTRAAEMTAAAA